MVESKTTVVHKVLGRKKFKLIWDCLKKIFKVFALLQQKAIGTDKPRILRTNKHRILLNVASFGSSQIEFWILIYLEDLNYMTWYRSQIRLLVNHLINEQCILWKTYMIQMLLIYYLLGDPEVTTNLYCNVAYLGRLCDLQYIFAITSWLLLR